MKKVWRPVNKEWKIACKKCSSLLLSKYWKRNWIPVLQCKGCWHIFRYRICPHCKEESIRFAWKIWDNYIHYCSSCKKNIWTSSWSLKKFAGGNSSKKRVKDDFYATFPEDVLPLLEVEKFLWGIWEPACGDGAISDVLISEYWKDNVYSSDLVDRGYWDINMDFIKQDIMPNWIQNIITNPPFENAINFVDKWMALLPEWWKMALLLKLAFFEGKNREHIYANYPPKTAYVFKKRLSFRRSWENSKYKWWFLSFAWYVWEKWYWNTSTDVKRI